MGFIKRGVAYCGAKEDGFKWLEAGNIQQALGMVIQ
jgi:hypothetical protein